ncbi:MAG: hypothetical protein AB3N13_07680 [Arenibacterium sp.]
MKRFFSLLCALSLILPTNVFADGGGNYSAKSNSLSNALTKKVVRTLTRGADRCQRLDWFYRYDCYRSVYAVAANQLGNNDAYANARAILLEVERSFEQTIARNEDKTAPRKRRGVEQFRAVKPGSRNAVNRDFAATLQRAETKLLRSPSNSGDHFVRIAQAVNTNKVLIRSASLLSPFSPFAVAFVAPVAFSVAMAPAGSKKPVG